MKPPAASLAVPPHGRRPVGASGKASPMCNAPAFAEGGASQPHSCRDQTAIWPTGSGRGRGVRRGRSAIHLLPRLAGQVPGRSAAEAVVAERGDQMGRQRSRMSWASIALGAGSRASARSPSAAWRSPIARDRSPARNTARASSRRASRCRRAAAPTAWASPTTSTAAPMSRPKIPHYRAEGVASWYGRDFHGRLTANGEVYDMHSISAAHTDAAAAELCARDQSRQRPLHHRARQRSRSVPPQPRHRPLDRDRQGARLLQQGPCPRAGRICRTRADRGQRRHAC